MVQFIIKKKRREGFSESDNPKDEIASVFAKARLIAENSVRDLSQLIEEGKYIPRETEHDLLASVEASLSP